MKSLLHFFLATSVLSIATMADSEPATAPAAPSAGVEQPGNRVAEVPAEMRDGALRFRVLTAGPAGGRIYYEILRP